VEGLLLFIHIFVSLLLIIVVMLQSGKSADLAGAFGGGGSQSTFGPRGTASLLSKLTTVFAVTFMITSLLLYIVATNKVDSDTVLGKNAVKQHQKQTTPVKGTTDKKEEKKIPEKSNKTTKETK